MKYIHRIFTPSLSVQIAPLCLFFLLFLLIVPAKADDQNPDTARVTTDTIKTADKSLCRQPWISGNGRRIFPPCPDTAWKKMMLRNQQAPFGRKFLRGAGLVFASQALSYSLLFVMPESFTNWDRSVLKFYGQNMKAAYTKPPVLDGDHWYINYIGHPFQGSFYYNAYRSQGAPFWQSALLATGHSFVWEYVIESGIERPSIQDLVVTPVVGSFMGELFHFATRRMAHNGFKWYEAAVVCIINPMFALNNGFKFAGKPLPKPL